MLKDLVKEIKESGYAFLPRWSASQSTLELSSSIGKVLSMERILPNQKISSVQTLRPRAVNEAALNQYSGVFGTSSFPLHTDLAHWAQPPRYFVLRSKTGHESVSTTLIPAAIIAEAVGNDILRRALSRPRRWRWGEPRCLLPLVFHINGIVGLRWDSIFLLPVNESAQAVAKAMLNESWESAQLKKFELIAPGDTLIVDNWQMLHGRTQVPVSASARSIERVYLSELNL